jgi:hypothetical protein
MIRKTKGRRRQGSGRQKHAKRQTLHQAAPGGRPKGSRARGGKAGLAVQVLCQHADGVRLRTHRLQVGRLYRRSAGAGAAAVWKNVEHKRLAELAAGFAHPQRVVLVRALMEGATSYRQIRLALRAKAGPLYHHVKQLRLCGLLQVGPRDVYRLTEAGQLAAGVLCAMERLLARIR